jgi:OFA family oxalate/formate antiporter-like MFS transporter
MPFSRRCQAQSSRDPRTPGGARGLEVSLCSLCQDQLVHAPFYLATNPLYFVLLSGMVFFAWGEIYSLFPATATDMFGRKFATTNYGLLYTAKGTAVPLSSVLTTWTGNWHAVFIVGAVLNVLAAFMALFVLKPMRIRIMAKG